MYKKIFVFITILYFFLSPFPLSAQTNTSKSSQTLEAIIIRVIEEKNIEVMQKKQLFQKLELEVTKGSLKGKKITVENGTVPLANQVKYQVDDKVMLSTSKGADGKIVYFIADYVRRDSLLILFIIFVALTVAVAKIRGIMSLIGMGISFLVIFFIILPQISSGADPVSAAILGSLIIIPISFFLSHGFNKKTFVAIGGTLIALFITGILSNIFVEAARLTGFASEEAGFLQVAKQGAVNMKGLLLAGIIIGVLGVLDDITVSQSAIVFQLKEANHKLSADELFKRGMNIGQDHISSMVNTLILVYTGASLPLLLLFINNPLPFAEIINYEIIADEIIRTLVGSIGLILSVPVTTFIAAYAAVSRK